MGESWIGAIYVAPEIIADIQRVSALPHVSKRELWGDPRIQNAEIQFHDFLLTLFGALDADSKLTLLNG